jgi:hypothetical protein
VTPPAASKAASGAMPAKPGRLRAAGAQDRREGLAGHYRRPYPQPRSYYTTSAGMPDPHALMLLVFALVVCGCLVALG